MALYPFETQLVLSANGGTVLVTDAVVTIYGASDTGMTTPLQLVGTGGAPLANPVQVSRQGFLPAFQATVPQVLWSGGGYSGYLNSFQGVLDEAIGARNEAAASASAALSAQAAAESAGGLSSVTYANLPAGSTITIKYGTSSYPARPTTRADIYARWRGPVPPASGGTGAITDIDVWENTTP